MSMGYALTENYPLKTASPRLNSVRSTFRADMVPDIECISSARQKMVSRGGKGDREIAAIPGAPPSSWHTTTGTDIQDLPAA